MLTWDPPTGDPRRPSAGGAGRHGCEHTGTPPTRWPHCHHQPGSWRKAQQGDRVGRQGGGRLAVPEEDSCPCPSSSHTYSSWDHSPAPDLMQCRPLLRGHRHGAFSSPTALYLCPKALPAPKPQAPGGQRSGAKCQEQCLRDKAPLSAGFPSSEMTGRCGISGHCVAQGPG